ncbi:MAG: hypothetical protein ACXW2I_13180, partial [Burkholderiales bacterium]
MADQECFGLPAHLTGSVLASGGGDGAMQDYLRLTTGRASAMGVLDALLPATGATAAARALITHAVFSTDLQLQHSLLWGDSDKHDRSPLMVAQNEYVDLIKRLQSHAAVWTGLVAAFKSMPGGRPAERVVLAHACDHLLAGYALNRFVTLLVAALVRGVDPTATPMMSRTRTLGVRP